MALTAKLLQLRPMCRPIPDSSFTRFFSDEPNSSPNSTTTNAEATSSPSRSKSEFSSFFSDVKASLRQHPPPSPPRRPSPPRVLFNPSSAKPPSTIESLEEIRKNLSEFRRRSSDLPPSASGDGKPPSSSPAGSISFLELFKRNVLPNANTNNQLPAGRFSHDAIRESLSQLKRSSTTNQANGMGKMKDSMSLSRFQESLKLKPVDPNEEKSPVVIGGSDNLPLSVFGKEMNGKMEDHRGKAAMRTEFVRMYSFEELGKKLKMFRPDKKDKKKSGFSLAELNERLIRLREYEEKENELRSRGIPYKDLRESLRILQETEDDKKKSTTIHRLSVLGQIGGTPSFMLSPPKEHLVEMYFHPDNMSSAEKLKLDLKKVRDEFKMSESDCGSARVQVAQLTTKIKHLSSVLHKKDKHSRKGLIAMVQRRKKLLKYIRRTDWDSYCLVLSKLGLRDNPDLKY